MVTMVTSLLCRQVTLNGWKEGIRAELQLEIRSVCGVRRRERAPPSLQHILHEFIQKREVPFLAPKSP